MLDYDQEYNRRFHPEAIKNGKIWEETPVSPQEFFTTFFPEPFFPIQQEMVDAALGIDPLKWDTDYSEIIALFGKG